MSMPCVTNPCFVLSSLAIMNLTVFIFVLINLHLYQFSQRSSSALPFNLSIYGTLLFVQIVLAHFRYVQFECFIIPHIFVFVVTQIEYIEFH